MTKHFNTNSSLNSTDFTPNQKFQRKIHKRHSKHIGAMIVTTLIVANVGVLSYMGYGYVKSLHWSNQDRGLAMADQSIDVLYDTSYKSRHNKSLFDKLYGKMVSDDGNLTQSATKRNLINLASYIDNMNQKTNIQSYKDKYDTLKDKLSVKSQYDKLFSDSNYTQLRGTVTPKSVSDAYNATHITISKLFAKNNKDAYVDAVNKMQVKLKSDSDIINTITDEFSKAYAINDLNNKSKVAINANYFTNLPYLYKTQRSKLNYNWGSLAYIDNIVNNTTDDLVNIINRHSKYLSYLDDEKAKKDAYANWENTKNQYLEQQQAQAQAKADSEKAAQESAKQASQDASIQESESIQADKDSSSRQADYNNQQSSSNSDYYTGTNNDGDSSYSSTRVDSASSVSSSSSSSSSSANKSSSSTSSSSSAQ